MVEKSKSRKGSAGAEPSPPQARPPFQLPPDLRALTETRRAALGRSHWDDVRTALEALHIDGPVEVNCSGRSVRFDVPGGVPPEDWARLELIIERLKPWRKGPFQVCGRDIDAEWRSDLKWERIASAIPPLAGLRLLDIGCNNGYYLFRASAHGATLENPPELLLGIDPSEAFAFAFSLFQKFYRHDRIHYELLGVEHVRQMPQSFDVVLCLGILYHHRDPISLLDAIRGSLVPGGTAIIESQTIPGETSVALFPEGRYAKAHNVYFVPTSSCLISWMKRAGFRNIELLAHTPVTDQEQRRTKDMQFESLADFLDPNDRHRTIEGYPAPWRTAIKGTV